MIKICLQNGHGNKAGGGAPEEQANNKRIADRLAFKLRERGIEVYQTDWYANNDPKVTGEDYSLFLALHCDMDYPGDNGGGFADYPDPATDGATAESQRICGIFNANYFPETQIKYVNHSNANTRFYYMWKYLTAKTPCVLVEMGQSIDPHDKILLANTDLIANALLKCILVAFNLPVDVPQPDPHLAEIIKLNEKITFLESSLKDLSDRLAQLEGLVATKEEELETSREEVRVLTEENQKLSEDVEYYKPYKSRYEEALTKIPNSLTAKQLFSIAWKKFWEERKAK